MEPGSRVRRACLRDPQASEPLRLRRCEDITAAYDRAFACDPKSAFGGIIACNREVPFELVEHFADQNKQFVEVIIAPSYTAEALERMAKRPNLRVLATGGVDHGAKVELRSIDGGMLVQEVDHVIEDPATFTFPTDRKPTDAEMAELEFAWKVCKGVKSNAILVSKGKAGIGMGRASPTALTPHCLPASAPRTSASARAWRRAALPAQATRSSRSATTSTCLPRTA